MIDDDRKSLIEKPRFELAAKGVGLLVYFMYSGIQVATGKRV